VTLPDAALLTDDQRRSAAVRIRQAGDITPWPDLEWFNSSPCAAHADTGLNPLCRRCGIRLRKHQRTGSTWMYLGLPGLLSDTMGSGKTAQVLAMLAMCKQNGELGTHNRAVIVCKAAAVNNAWGDEIRRLTPGLRLIVADGSREERIAAYMGDWEVAVVSDRTFAPASGAKRSREGDVEYIRQFPIGILVYDDVDQMRNHETRAHWAIMRLAADCTRVVGLHATPLQKKLIELYCFLLPVGGEEALGSLTRVRTRYVTRKRVWIRTADRGDKQGRKVVRRAIWVDNGIVSDPARVAEFRKAIAPLVLRRTAEDLDGDTELPAIQVNPIAIELNPRQRSRYNELRTGVLRRLTAAGGVEITKAESGAVFTRGQQICSGLAALDDGIDDSAKLDQVMTALTGDLAADKSVVFIYFRPNVAALSQRLKDEGLGHVLMWSTETDKRERSRRLARFRDDPACRVLVGTTTIEASLNLQCARHIIAVDTILNPARMSQVVGRVRRQGSAYSTVYFHHLLAVNTQEDGYLELLRREQSMSDAVWNETSDIFTTLSPRQQMMLVATGSAFRTAA
jgi:SNF2 family DNA or RNA helicase